MHDHNESETPAGANAVDEELTAWEELLASDPKAEQKRIRERWNVDETPRNDDIGSVRGRWGASADSIRGSTETLSRDYDSRFPEPVRDPSVVRVIFGALDPRTFNSKLRWFAIIIVLLLGILVPFGVSAGLALWVGAPTPAAAVVGTLVTVAYWKFF